MGCYEAQTLSNLIFSCQNYFYLETCMCDLSLVSQCQHIGKKASVFFKSLFADCHFICYINISHLLVYSPNSQGWAKGGSLELNPGLSQDWQVAMHLSHHLFPPEHAIAGNWAWNGAGREAQLLWSELQVSQAALSLLYQMQSCCHTFVKSSR